VPERTAVEVARAGYHDLAAALASGDAAGVVERWCDPNVVLNPAGAFPDSSAQVHGREAMLQFLTTQAEAFDPFVVEPLEFIDAGDRVVVPVRFGGRARHTGIEINFSLVHVLTLRNGLLVQMDSYASKREALEAVGLAGEAKRN
jgi:ketosteroid isomerase-like protein